MWAIGDECEAKDKKGTWYEAKIKRVKGDGDERKHFVKFSGWGERYNEWLLAEKIRPRDPEWLYQDEATVDSFEKGEEGHVEEDAWEVEKIVKMKTVGGTRFYLFHFAGERWKDKSHDVWVAEEDVGEAAIEEFEEQRKPVNSQVQVGPYVSTAAQTIDEELADDLVEEWADDVGRKGAAILERQKDELADKVFFKMSPCPPWVYLALHRRWIKLAELTVGRRATPGATPPREPPHTC